MQRFTAFWPYPANFTLADATTWAMPLTQPNGIDAIDDFYLQQLTREQLRQMRHYLYPLQRLRGAREQLELRKLPTGLLPDPDLRQMRLWDGHAAVEYLTSALDMARKGFDPGARLSVVKRDSKLISQLESQLGAYNTAANQVVARDLGQAYQLQTQLFGAGATPIRSAGRAQLGY